MLRQLVVFLPLMIGQGRGFPCKGDLSPFFFLSLLSIVLKVDT